jgi:hypothetical protein
LSGGQEIEFQEIIAGDKRFLKHYLDFRTPEKIGRHNFDHEIESLNNALKTFDLMIKVVRTKFSGD